MSIAEWVATLAAICTTISFVPQVLLVLKTKNTQSISLIMYTVFTTGVALWMLYGFMTWQWPIIFANIITFILAFIILLFKLSENRKKGRPM